PEGQQQVVPAADTAVGEPLGLGYGALRRPYTYHMGGRVYIDIPAYVPPVAPVQPSPSPEWSSGSLPVLPSSLVVATPEATISVDEDQFLEVGA
ncbi:hypothetical protein Tco_0383712, partial [Tanacetum coccineum]